MSAVLAPQDAPSRESRRFLKWCRAACDCCEFAETRECDTCHEFEPPCRLMEVREYVECVACWEKRRDDA